MTCVPVGFRFHPTDEELIRHYLYAKNNIMAATAEEQESMAAIVPELDLYGDMEPWKIWESNGGADLYDQDLYFFARLKKVNPHGTRINRKIGSGTWSEGEPSRPVFVGGESKKKNKGTNPIGRKRKFRYENKASDQHGLWYMEEYSLLGVSSADYVICRLRENVNRSGLVVGGGCGGPLSCVQLTAAMEATGPVPVGFRFHPTDQELISYFLWNKNKGKGAGQPPMLLMPPPPPLLLKVKEEQVVKSALALVMEAYGDDDDDDDEVVLVEDKENEDTQNKARPDNNRVVDEGNGNKERPPVPVPAPVFVEVNNDKGNQQQVALPPVVMLVDDENNNKVLDGQLFPEHEHKSSNGDGEVKSLVMMEENNNRRIGDEGDKKKEMPVSLVFLEENNNDKVNMEGEQQVALPPVLLVEDKKKNKNKVLEGPMVPQQLLLEYDHKSSNGDGEGKALVLIEVDPFSSNNKENKFLHEFDLFGSTNPWEIWDLFKGDELKDQDLFFFTQLKKVNPKGSRIGRKIGSGGTWSEGDVSKTIYDARTSKPVGRKRKLRYENFGSPHHACWYLDEYSLLEADIGDYVICRLRKNEATFRDNHNSSGSGNSRKRKFTSTSTATPSIPESKEEEEDKDKEKEKDEVEDSSKGKRKCTDATLTPVEEAAADVLMNMANNTINNKLKLFGIEIGSTPPTPGVGGE